MPSKTIFKISEFNFPFLFELFAKREKFGMALKSEDIGEFRCQTISRNTLANANATRPWQIYADFAQHLIGLARPLYAKEPFGLELDAAV